MPAAETKTDGQWAETFLHNYIVFARKAGLTLAQISAALIEESIAVLGRDELEKMHADPRIRRAIITCAMRSVADQLDHDSRMQLQ
jgi:hypothetical protein